ncbi:hypothetical protein [Neobacillus drentensis]|uniref:hypothetical protein n=1 Tax=Neobacillus drentensis TaxID=220684 RepID=UPI00285BFB13|nr:hypothetical protein [Neobacillus drentensis]MDR7237097.1 hypothetical protein [Neobacillus drentensis]
MPIMHPALCLNTDDPDQKELYEFITRLPNGKKRNTSAFLKTLVDREYQKKKEQYLAEIEKETLKAPRVEVIKREIKYLAKEVNQNTDDRTNSSPN